MADEKVTFKNFRGMELKGVLSYPDSGDKFPGIIISHGFLSFKENKLLYRIADKLQENGFAALRFDFSGCVGESQGICEDMMLSHQINDLISGIGFLSSNDKIDSERIGLVGHSLGGITSIIVSTRDDRVKALATIGAPAKLQWQNLITDEFAQMWEHDKKAKFKSLKGSVEIDFAFYKDMKEYDGEDIIQDLKTPIRIIHGNKDDIVPLRNANALFEKAGGEKDLQVIENGDHLFLKKEFTDKVTELVSGWMLKVLK